jgi:hypothetical protein
MTFDEAVRADRMGEMQLAATRYEALLGDAEVSVDVLLNLAILYWQATDPGIAASKRLSPEFLGLAASRVPTLLAVARTRYQDRTEPRFWDRYIAWADLGEPLTLHECRHLLEQQPSELTPAMHIFALTEGNEARREALELLRWCARERTTRANYVASVIRGVLARNPSIRDTEDPARG